MTTVSMLITMRLLQGLVAVAGLQGQNVGRHGTGHAPGDAGIELPGEKHGLVGGDVARGGADMERRGAGVRGGTDAAIAKNGRR